MNYSRQREIILDALKNNVVHPTAEYLYDKLKTTEPRLSLATLYRNLNKLAEAGLIKKIDGLDNSAHFDHNTHDHYHFICNTCGRVFDVSSGIAPEIAAKTEKETGFKIDHYDIIFQGMCNDCNKGENQ